MRLRRGRPPYPGPITPAEARVLELIRDGRSNAEIAVRLGLSVNTVRYHVSNLLTKAEAKTRAELRGWEPSREPSGSGARRIRGGALMLSLAKWGAAAACVTGIAVAGLVAFSSFQFEDDGPPFAATLASPTATPTPFEGVVVGDVGRTAGGYEIVEASTQQAFELADHARLSESVGQRVVVFGRVEGSRIVTRRVEPLEEGRVVSCWGVLKRDGLAYALDGGVCKGFQLTSNDAARMVNFVSEKVTMPVAACSVTRDGRLDEPRISLFGDPTPAAC